MSRPVDLPANLQVWAKANYGAGPVWGGTPQRSTPAGTTLTPGVTLPAEILNYLHGNAYDAAQGAINAVGQMPALNWGGTANTNLSAGSTQTIAWNDVDQSWFAIGAGASTSLSRTLDFGKFWSVNASFVSAIAYDIAFDTSGNCVVVQSAGQVVESAYFGWFASLASTYTFVARAGVIPSLSSANVVYEPVSGLWCIVGEITGTGMRVSTSVSRATWTARTFAGTWASATTTIPYLGVGNGIIIAAYVDTTSGAVRTQRSADGGVTWTNDQALTLSGFVATGAVRPVWSATDSLWYLAASSSSALKVQIFSSPDGITWASAAALTTNGLNFVGLATIGSLLVAQDVSGRVCCSFNKGVTWFRCGYNACVLGMRGGGNGLMAWLGAAAAPSQRFGLPVTAV